MFSTIAPRYDLLNRLLSLGTDRRWRHRAVARLGWEMRPEGTYLDACAGTLDLAAALAVRRGFRGSVVGADFAVPMLEMGLHKAPQVFPVGADALRLPFADETFDGAMVAFGIRNLSDSPSGLRELRRVLASGARLVVVEFSLPECWPIRQVYRWYFGHVLPRVGRMISRHPDAYAYLPASVDRFPSPHEFAAQLTAAGFRDVTCESLSFGIATLYVGGRV